MLNFPVIKRKLCSGLDKFSPRIYEVLLRKLNFRIKSKNKPMDLSRKKVIGKNTFVFLSHDAGLRYHLISLCILAKTMKALGHDVLMISCSGQLKRCTVKDSCDLPLDSKRALTTCLKCENNGLEAFQRYGLPYVDLATLLSGEEYQHAIKALENPSFGLSSMDFKNT